jgi:dTDP-glucose 4,6-dehydratase
VSAGEIVAADVRAILAGVGEASFRRLDGRTVLLTGCTGVVGVYLLETLGALNDHVFDRPCRVQVVTRSRSRVAERWPHLAGRADFTWLETDVRALDADAARGDFVVHAAAPSDARLFLEDPAETMDAIVRGTAAVLRAASRARAEAMLFVSSGAVYGPQPADLAAIPEDWPGAPDLADPRSCYGEAKRCAEVLCAAAGSRQALPVSIARVFTVVGPGQDINSTSAVADFIRQAQAGHTITVRGDGDAVRSYAYLTDVVTALWKILLACPPGRVLNVGSDLEPITFRELASRVGQAAGRAVAVDVLGQSEPGVLGRRYVPNLERLAAETGLRPQVGLDEALARTVRWMDAKRGDRTCV